METPSSIKRVTRSQTLALNSNNNIPLSRKIEDSSDKGVTKSRRMNAKQQQLQDRSALIDITNDSPIQKNSRVKNIILNTPGSGEALLRGQVKTLLQKVEEEAELSKLSLENRPFLHLQGFVNSPMGLLAPTPANTPQVPDISGDDIVLALPVIEEKLKICQEVSEIFDVKKQDSLESQKSLTRSLLLDFSEKSESIDSSECSSALTYQGDNCEVITSESKDKSSLTDDDNASIWSIQVNASTNDEEEEEEVIEEEEEEYFEAADAGGLLDELCEGISKISVKEKVMANDDEIVEEVADCEDEDSDDDFRLKGLPTPKGKHIRFHTEEE
ncbi:myelin transcription factor [Salix suchowensis]|nr:myelin transcription factor [Salix suchowensis]